ncbi:5-hydroxytryptamine receptor 3A-like isoform X1 [Seriola lalandi dorsalis]|nr:5-hydroxytryptamine receptor 3A-like isoform X1 [Seriola lalandi dorsalis]XP_056258379.1 5-hydroxytryptamine receptor 3A-like isoform X1 [Seriola aureovittata]
MCRFCVVSVSEGCVFLVSKGFFSSFPEGIASSQTSDCSYGGLLNYLNLTSTNNVLEITRPVKNWTTPTLVHLDMLLYGILEVDEKSQTVTSHIWFQMRWQNEFLTWNSSDFCGIDMLTIPRSRLWIPDVTIQEDASDSGSIQNSPLITLIPSGSVLAKGIQRLTFTCQMNLFLFPFDIQHCSITFTSMNYNGETLKLATTTSDTTLTSISERIMITHGEWQLKTIEVFNYTPTQDNKSEIKLVYMIKIMRKPMLYVINLIIPLLYFLVLDLASFFINEARGEKLSFKVTILLSISVLLLILQDMLPSTEVNLPIIATYSVTIFTLVGISVLEAILVSFLMELDDYCGKKTQSSVKTQVEIQLEADYHQEHVEVEEKGQVNPVPLNSQSDHNLLRLILEEVKAARQEAGSQDKDKRKPGRYKRLAEITDSVFFVLYLLTVIIFLIYMYILWCENCIANDNH